MRNLLTRAALPATVAAILLVVPVTAQSHEWTHETIYDQNFDLPAGGRLVVDVGDMDIRVRTGGSARVEVIAGARDLAFARERFEDMDFSARASGGTLEIETSKRHYDLTGEQWRRYGGASYEAIITVPSRLDVDLRTGDGDVWLESVEGTISIHTGDGDVMLGSVSGPEVSLHTGDGDVTAQGIDSPSITLDTGDGDLIVEDLAGAVSARTGDGDVHLDVREYAGLTVRTGDGDVTVFADPSIRATLDVAGEDLSVGRSFTVTGTLREDRLDGTLNGGGPELRIRTGDGSIAIRSR